MVAVNNRRVGQGAPTTMRLRRRAPHSPLVALKPPFEPGSGSETVVLRQQGANERECQPRFLMISRISSAVADGVLPTLTPAASRASFLAAAVPDEPDTMAPA